MAKYVAWVDTWIGVNICSDQECNAIGNSTWDTRVIYCSTQCFRADGHKDTPMGADDSHGVLSRGVLQLEPDCCEHCAACDTKVIQGIECEDEHDEECIANAKGGA